jgi:hypothetical protein
VDGSTREDFNFGQPKKEASNSIVIDWYCMCKKSGETINHLLLHYEVARDLWFQPFVFLALSGLCPKGWCSCWCAGEVSWEAVVD